MDKLEGHLIALEEKEHAEKEKHAKANEARFARGREFEGQFSKLKNDTLEPFFHKTKALLERNGFDAHKMEDRLDLGIHPYVCYSITKMKSAIGFTMTVYGDTDKETCIITNDGSHGHKRSEYTLEEINEYKLKEYFYEVFQSYFPA